MGTNFVQGNGEQHCWRSQEVLLLEVMGSDVIMIEVKKSEATGSDVVGDNRDFVRAIMKRRC